jgi:hypothetical protein
MDETDTVGTRVLVQASSQDNNVRPVVGSHRDGAGSLHTFRKLNTDLPEEAAEFFEGLARDYDGGMIREGAIQGDSGQLTGFRAYHLWANRYAKATGMTLRDPRIDHVTYGGLPHYLFKKAAPRIEIKKGDTIDLAQAQSLIEGNHEMRVALSNGEERRLGFISSGRVCVFGRKKRRTGSELLGPVHAAESLDTWANRPGIEHADDIVSDVTQKDNHPDAVFVMGYTQDKVAFLERAYRGFLWNTSPRDYETMAGFTDKKMAARAVAVLNKVLPHANAKTITADALPPSCFPHPPVEKVALPMAALVTAPAPVVDKAAEIPRLDRMANLTAAPARQASLGL